MSYIYSLICDFPDPPTPSYAHTTGHTPPSTMVRCVQYVRDALSMDGTLDREAHKRRTLFFTYITASGLCCLAALTQLELQLSVPASTVVTVGLPLFSLYGAVNVLLKRDLTTRIIMTVLMAHFATFIMWDLASRVMNGVEWPVIVLLVDILLVMQMPQQYSTFVVCCTVAWFVLVAVEESFRFGLFEMPGLLPQEGEVYSRRAYLTKLVDCETLPCPVDFPPTGMASSIGVFIIDFLVTRGFAAAVRAEQASMERTIATVQEIASLLAGYDVEQVAELLQAHEKELPEGMAAALRKLEQNLRMYKAYLPQTCLPFDEDVVSRGSDDTMSCASVPTPVSLKLPVFAAHKPIATHVQPLLLSSTKATLLTLNIKDTLHRLEEDSARFSDLFTTVLLKTLQATDNRRGMVDVFVGDRIHCSFNTSKQCASHATSALHAASMLMRAGLAASVSVGVAMGTVLRGDMGCEVMRRFSMVGTLVRDVHGMERAGRMLGCDVLCNRLCFSDAECEHDLRLLPCKVEVASGCEAQPVAELVSKQEETLTATKEWMYQIGGKQHWEDYNTVVRGYLRGESCDTDVAKAWVEAGGSGTPAHAVPSGTCSVLTSCFTMTKDVTTSGSTLEVCDL